MPWNATDPRLVAFHSLSAISEARFFFRIVRSEHHRPDDFRSAFDLGHPPPRRLQNDSALIWMAISMFTTFEAAASRARLMPKIGSHVAKVHIDPGRGFAYAETIQPGHMSVWGDPFKLDARVLEVYPVQ